MADRDSSSGFYRDRWSANVANTTGATVIAAAPAIHPLARQHLEFLYAAAHNKGATVSPCTVTVQVRAASPQGTVLASMPMYVVTSTVGTVNPSSIGLPGKRGQPIVAVMDTFVGSVTYTVNIAGWTEQSGG